MDRDLRLQILRAVVRDRTFLKKAWRDIRAEDFPDREEVLVAQAGLGFYEKYEEPIGAMLKSEVDDLAGGKLGADSRQRLKELVLKIQGGKVEAVSVQALVDRVKSLRKTAFYDTAVEEMLTAHEEGTLSSNFIADLVERANKELSADKIISHDYYDGLEKRIARRATDDSKRYPLSLIDPLDEKLQKLAGRGHLCLFMAPPNAGKGLALIHMAVAYALQGLNVLHITLEDPKEEVENRLDSCMTGIPLDKLKVLPNRLRKRWLRQRKHMRGKIKIIDGTDGGWGVTQVEKAWEQEKREGFVADVVIVDYDDEIECEKKFKGDAARRFEFAEIYRRLRKMAAKLDVILWTAAQGKRDTEGRKVLTMKDVAEDISKIRKAFVAIGIGSVPDIDNMKFLYVMRHKVGRSRFGVKIMSNYAAAIFYDREATMRMRRLSKKDK